jgi:glyoxylase-like metal-dependent hydrolase (beta-lactamase superfamily II)
VTDSRTPETVELPGAKISRISVGPLDNNVYLVEDLATQTALLIDAANETERILEMVEHSGSKVALILTTHQHPDHWQSLADVAKELDAPTAIGRLDASGVPVPADQLLADGDELRIGELHLPVVELRGHTPGSVALSLSQAGCPAHIFTGDSLFPGGVGKTTSPEDFDSLINDVAERIFGRFPDHTEVHPGHGTGTTLGVERPRLGEWRARGW